MIMMQVEPVLNREAVAHRGKILTWQELAGKTSMQLLHVAENDGPALLGSAFRPQCSP